MTLRARTEVATTEGTFLGAAVGDALGWPQELRGGLKGGKSARESAEPGLEFRSWTRTAGHRSRRYDDLVRPGEYSDDTQLLLATARACFAGDKWLHWLVNVELPTWPLYQRGGGGAVLSAARSWASGRPPWAGDDRTQKRYANAGANGVAMRIAPHIFWADEPRDLVARVFSDGITTHGHPRALVGALTYASVLHYAASSNHTLQFGELVDVASRALVPSSEVVKLLPDGWGDAELFCKTWEATNIEMAQLLDEVKASLEQGALSPPTATLERLGCTDPSVNGAGTVTAAGAIYLAARFASRPSGGLLAAAFLRGGDTDTLASMTGAVLGSLHGTDWTNGLAYAVQDRDYLVDMALLTAQRQFADRRIRGVPPLSARQHLLDLLTAGNTSSVRLFPDGRSVAAVSMEPLGGQQQMHRATLQLRDGQVVFVDVEVKTTTPPPAGGQASQRGYTADQNSSAAIDAVRLPTTQPAAERAAVAGIVLPSANLRRCAAFYAQLLGVDVPIRDRTLKIAPWLMLREADHTSMEAAGEIALTVTDLDAVIERMNVDPASRRGDTIWLRDPDGRVLFVDQAKGTASPPAPQGDRTRAREVSDATFELFEDKAGAFRFQMRAANGEIVGTSPGYPSMADAERAMKTLKTVAKFGLFVESAAEILQRGKK